MENGRLPDERLWLLGRAPQEAADGEVTVLQAGSLKGTKSSWTGAGTTLDVFVQTGGRSHFSGSSLRKRTQEAGSQVPAGMCKALVRPSLEWRRKNRSGRRKGSKERRMEGEKGKKEIK